MNILETYHTLSFILMGDSGEKDADIYIAMAKEYSKQMKAIYLRSVDDAKRMLRVEDRSRRFDQIRFLSVGEFNEAKVYARIHGLLE